MPGVILIGFSASKNDIGTGNGKIDATDLITKALGDPVTDAEFRAAQSAFSSTWSKYDVTKFWLDFDTFKTGEASVESKIADAVTLADVKAVAEKLQKSPIASVLINPSNN